VARTAGIKKKKVKYLAIVHFDFEVLLIHTVCDEGDGEESKDRFREHCVSGCAKERVCVKERLWTVESGNGGGEKEGKEKNGVD
jgi:hypothetical protein